MALETWLAFFVACWVISLSPGAGAVASMSAGMQYGFWRGYWNALGLQLGLALQIAIVAAGVGAILAASALAFSLIKWFGVAYLVFLAYKQWVALPSDLDAGAAAAHLHAGVRGPRRRLRHLRPFRGDPAIRRLSRRGHPPQRNRRLSCGPLSSCFRAITLHGWR